MRRMMAVLATAGWVSLALAQAPTDTTRNQPPQHGTNNTNNTMREDHNANRANSDTRNNARQRDTAAGTQYGSNLSAAQAKSMLQQVDHSLADSIRIAEQKANGRAISAQCRYRTSADGYANDQTGDAMNRHNDRDMNRQNDRADRTQNDTDRQRNDQNRYSADTDKSKSESEVICEVTVLTNDNKLVEVAVCADTGKVLNQRQVQSLNSRTIGMSTASPIEQASYTSGSTGSTRTGHAHDSNMDFTAPRRWQKATDLTGKSIANASDKDLGTLKDIVVDANSGRILYGVVSYGGFLGLGNKLFAVPWQSLRLTDDAKKIILNIDEERLKNAEGFDQQQWPNFADERWATSTYEYYGQEPYWKSTATGSQTMSGSTYRDRWTQKVVQWQKVSDLCGKSVRASGDEDIGTMSDLAIDPDGGRVMYGILSFDGELLAVPWNAVDLTHNAKELTLNVDKSTLKNADGFSKDRWPDLTNQRWAQEAHQVFHVQPYWVEG